MKTIRTGLNQIFLATFFAVILITGSVQAEGTEVCTVSGLEKISEPGLQLENWMLNESYWHHLENFYAVTNVEEEVLSLETWMVDMEKWQVPAFEYIQNVKDPNLRIENWMTNRKYWN